MDVLEVLELAGLCRELGVLPRPGGVLDQDARLMYLFSVVFAAHAERQVLDNKREQDKANQARMRR